MFFISYSGTRLRTRKKNLQPMSEKKLTVLKAILHLKIPLSLPIQVDNNTCYKAQIMLAPSLHQQEPARRQCPCVNKFRLLVGYFAISGTFATIPCAFQIPFCYLLAFIFNHACPQNKWFETKKK